MKLSVIIPAYKRHPLTARHVEECLKAERLPDEIIVINDGGDPDLDKLLPQSTATTKIIYANIEEDILWNYNGAVNLGFFISSGDVIAIEDTDHIPSRDTYARGLELMLGNPDVGRISFGRRIVQVADIEAKKPMEEWTVTGQIGCNQMVAFLRREVYASLKGNDEQMCGNYGWMAYDFPYRRDKILGVKSLKCKNSFYWAVFGDNGEPGLKRGLSGANLKIYRQNMRARKNHSKYGILNFHYTLKTL